MRYHFAYYLISSIFCLIFSGNAGAQNVSDSLEVVPKDSVEIVKQTDALIEAMMTDKEKLKKEKVEYFSQLTRYGFKNLFQKNLPNTGMAYSSRINPHAESYIQDYLRSHSRHLEKMKTWGKPYFNLIDHIFVQYGIPRELKYLAVIESNLSTSATSWVGAGGPWQFMPYTARDYGLIVNTQYDERRDYVKSTHAAAKYLLALYKEMHDWLLVIAAYNGGPGRVNSAIRKSGSRNFWELQYYLPQESRNHVKKFIATHYIMEGNATLNTSGSALPGAGSNPYQVSNSLSVAEMELAEKHSLSGKYNSLIIAKNINLDIATFNRYNPEFDKKILANGQYELILPGDKMKLFLALKYQILNECVQMLLGDQAIPNNRTEYPKKYQRKSKLAAE